MLQELCPFVPAIVRWMFDFGVGDCINGGALLKTLARTLLIVIYKSRHPNHSHQQLYLPVLKEIIMLRKGKKSLNAAFALALPQK